MSQLFWHLWKAVCKRHFLSLYWRQRFILAATAPQEPLLCRGPTNAILTNPCIANLAKRKHVLLFITLCFLQTKIVVLLVKTLLKREIKSFKIHQLGMFTVPYILLPNLMLTHYIKVLSVLPCLKNDLRNSGGTLRQKLQHIDFWYLTFEHLNI